MGHSPKRVLVWGPRRDARPAGERRSGGALEGYPKRKLGDPTWSAARDDAYAQKERPGGEPYRLCTLQNQRPAARRPLTRPQNSFAHFSSQKSSPRRRRPPPPAASGASQAIRKAFISPGLTDKKSTCQLRRRQNLRVVCFTGSQLDLFLLLLAFQVPHLYGAGKKRGQRAQAP